MENEQYAFMLGALARIDKKVDLMNANIQEIKIDVIHMQEDIDEARADISELKEYNSHFIDKEIEKMEELTKFTYILHSLIEWAQNENTIKIQRN